MVAGVSTLSVVTMVPSTSETTSLTLTSPSVSPGLTLAICHAAAPPVGSVETITSPPSSTATQKLAELHVTACSVPPVGSAIVCQAPAPPAGSLETITSPLRSSVAAQNWAVGQEMPASPISETRLVVVQVLGPPAGFEEVTTSPLSLTAAQKPLGAQETPANSPPLLIGSGSVHLKSACGAGRAGWAV